MSESSQLPLAQSKIADKPGRNDPCPCGSGKRFKHCHGAVTSTTAVKIESHLDYPQWACLSVEQKVHLSETMTAALRAQTRGELIDAERLYRSVLDVAPDTFDALHMLGVIRFVNGDYESAEKLIRAAIEIVGPLKDFESNLQLCLDKQRMLRLTQGSWHEPAYAVLRDAIARTSTIDTTTLTSLQALLQGLHVTRVELIYPIDVLSCGTWILARQIAASLPASISVACRPVSIPGVPSISDIGSADDPITDYDGTARVVVGPIPPSVVESAINRDIPVILIMDRDDPAPVLDLLFSIDSRGAKWHVVSYDAVIARKVGCPLMQMVTSAIKPREVSTPSARERVGVFVPDVGPISAADRWNLIVELRRRYPAIDLLYFRSLPAEHLPTAEEHLVSVIDPTLVELSKHWRCLIYWGGSLDWRQFQSLLSSLAVPDLIVHVSTGLVANRTDGSLIHYFCDSHQAMKLLGQVMLDRGNV